MRVLMAALVLALGTGFGTVSVAAEADFAVSEAGVMEAYPALAYDSRRDRFLSVWTDMRNDPVSGLDVMGRFVDGQGRAVGPDLEITGAKRSQGFANVAYDPVNDRYLVLWTDTRNSVSVDMDVYGRLLNGDGTPHGAEFAVASSRGFAQKHPNLVFDPKRQRFLVLWEQTRYGGFDQVYGRYVGADGRPQGSEFPIAPLPDHHQDGGSLLYDPERDRYFIVWRDTIEIREGDDGSLLKGVYGAFMDAGSDRPGPYFKVALEETGCLPLSLYATTYAPGTDAYFVAWTSGRNYQDEYPLKPGEGKFNRVKGLDVYGTYVDVDSGKPLGPEFIISATVDYQRYASVAFDPNKRRYLVVWYDLRRGPVSGRAMDIYGRYIGLEGPASEEFLISRTGAGGIRRYPAVAFSPKSDKFLVLWEDGRKPLEGNRRIFGAVR